MKDEFKNGWFELTGNFCPKLGEKIQKLGRTVFSVENMRTVEKILDNVSKYEKDPAQLETIKYIWWGIRRLTAGFPDVNKTKR